MRVVGGERGWVSRVRVEKRWRTLNMDPNPIVFKQFRQALYSLHSSQVHTAN